MIEKTLMSASSAISNVSRRRFLQGAGGLALGMYIGPLSAAVGSDSPEAPFKPNAFVQIDADGIVTVISKHLEMGQGVYTGLATLVAEELDADWNNVQVEGAPADEERYKNFALGLQGTGGSTAISNSYMQMREAGATARAMLVGAAAEQWDVPAQDIVVSNGVVRHAASGREASFGQLAEAASRQPVPAEVTLKSPHDFTLIGKPHLARRDSASKTDGSAVFTQDIQLPGMLIAAPVHPRRFGATVNAYDASKAKAVPGVVGVVEFKGTPHSFSGVAVLANNTWAALQGAAALELDWDESKAFKLGSGEILAQYAQAAETPGAIARQDGDVDAALAESAQMIEADYIVPFLAHASIEPLNCVVQLGEDRCELWNGEQWHTIDRSSVAQLLGIPVEQVFINQLYAGGSFGRRANPHADYVVEATAIAKAARDAGFNAPIKMVWSRENDMRGGYYRPANFHRARLGLDDQGHLEAMHLRLVGQSIMKGTVFDALVKDGVDATSVEGAATMVYNIPNLQVELHTPDDIGVPIQWFRSVGHTQNAFTVEGLIDEAAIAAGKDPVQFRLDLLADHPRHHAVLELAASKAGWDQPLAAAGSNERRGRGVAVHESFNSFVAEVAEVTIKDDGSLKVDRVVCVVDCGLAVNPDVIKAQMEGGIGFGLAAALHGEITLEDGMVVQSNFHDYPLLRINEMPEIEVHIVPSAEPPTGVGEPGVPPIAPAVVNAIYDAVGTRIRTLPIGDQLKANQA